MGSAVLVGHGTAIKLLDAVTATGAGASHKPVGAHRVFQVIGTFSGTVKIQGSMDDSNWVDLVTTTATGGWEDTGPWRHVRANVTAYTSGSITVIMGV